MPNRTKEMVMVHGVKALTKEALEHVHVPPEPPGINTNAAHSNRRERACTLFSKREQVRACRSGV